MQQVTKGVVKQFNAHKGFGFIGQKNGPDVFVHFSVIDSDSEYRELMKGDEVEYRAEANNDKLKATYCRITKPVVLTALIGYRLDEAEEQLLPEQAYDKCVAAIVDALKERLTSQKETGVVHLSISVEVYD